MRLLMLTALIAGLAAPVAAQQIEPGRPTGDQRQPNRPNAAEQDRGKSGSSQNTPTTGETTGRNNPSISTEPDNAPSRGTVRSQ
ncbi:MAG TPA: hypothetical protein VEC60_04050 [Reyranella sp.]|nr:hypothetical protein [Reyranella sp.]